MEECNRIKVCLNQYEKAYGQRISLENFIVAYSPNVPNITRSELCTTLGMVNSSLEEKYLGVLTIIGCKLSLGASYHWLQ